MKISVITVTFNSALTILDTVKSLNSQDYPDIEHIVEELFDAFEDDLPVCLENL